MAGRKNGQHAYGQDHPRATRIVHDQAETASTISLKQRPRSSEMPSTIGRNGRPRCPEIRSLHARMRVAGGASRHARCLDEIRTPCPQQADFGGSARMQPTWRPRARSGRVEAWRSCTGSATGGTRYGLAQLQMVIDPMCPWLQPLMKDARSLPRRSRTGLRRQFFRNSHVGPKLARHESHQAAWNLFVADPRPGCELPFPDAQPVRSED